MIPVEQKVWKMALPVAADLNLRLVRVRLSGGENPVLQVMLEPVAATPENRLSVTLKECEAFSREFAVLMDVDDPISQAYQLEVSSTGLERPLVTLEDFKAYAPHRVKLKTKVAIEGQRRFSGVLRGIEDGAVALQVDGKEGAVAIPLDEVATAKLAFTPQEEAAFIKAHQVDLGSEEF